MKLSHLILVIIAAIAFFYIQLWEHVVVTPLYLVLLSACTIYGVYKQDVNVAHISGYILVLTAIDHTIFATGLINNVTPEKNKLLQGTIIYGTHFLLSLAMVIVLIFRVQITRLFSNSSKVKLTHFDGIFHWIFIYNSAVYLFALLENIAWSYFEMKSWTLIYDNFEGLIYIAWALCCGALLTMMILSAREGGTQASRAS
ncbi:hypothetical protein CWB99_23770 [Pseudoalteromonas rubra]|uniref:Integral membrane protein n=1 Tax=Pseudoalteromonas rubra TaxID=43658 RepID=A0A5S3WFI2_9GAMM|nr:hypothetical protein [Pseudoalteromonas rubra]TMP22879.1 hypothetical protein CWB99_23770 [Pseudoalteromonas rubra]TMP27478.1 hypothetical protein CWC00_23335 [Pseudoalteromonas rubra]